MPREEFPRLNEGRELVKLKRYLVVRGVLAWLAAVVGVGVVAVAAYLASLGF